MADKDVIKVTEKDYEDRITQGYEQGIWSGVERAAAELMGIASREFVAGRDDNAAVYRMASKHMQDLSKILEKEYRNKYPRKDDKS